MGEINSWADFYQGKDRQVPMSLWSHNPRRGIIEVQAPYFFRILKLGLEFYEQYFDCPYPFSKYDQIFLPSFTFNAMENPGIVAILDKNFVPYMESVSQIINRDRMFLHEMCHMWNGNLMSIEYYNDLWLKEGFTEYICQLALQYLVDKSPKGTFAFEGRIMANFRIRGLEGFKIDLLCENDNHPLSNMCTDDKNTLQYYGHCTYRKGSLIAMHLSNLHGPDVFQEAFKRLISKYKFHCVNSDIFFATYEEILTERARTNEIEALTRFKQEFIMETNGPTVWLEQIIYERSKKWLKIHVKTAGIKKYLTVLIEVWDKD